MCKIGDIVAIQNYIGEDNQVIPVHYFIVVNDSEGEIEGLNFDIVASVMSSFKTEKQRQKKLKYEENLEIEEKDGIINNHNLKHGFVKADQLHYFKKEKTKYFVVGQVDGDVLIRILQLMQYLDTKGKLKQNIENLKANDEILI